MRRAGRVPASLPKPFKISARTEPRCAAELVAKRGDAAEAGKPCHFLDRTGPTHQQASGFVHPDQDESFARRHPGCVVETTQEGARAHRRFRRHIFDDPTPLRLGADPVEQGSQAVLRRLRHRSLHELRLAAAAMGWNDEPPSDGVRRVCAEILPAYVEHEVDAGGGAGGRGTTLKSTGQHRRLPSYGRHGTITVNRNVGGRGLTKRAPRRGS